MEVLILTKQYTYLLREILNSGVTSNFALNQKSPDQCALHLYFQSLFLLTKLNLIIVPLLWDSRK